MPFCRKTEQQILYLRKREILKRKGKKKVMVQHSIAKNPRSSSCMVLLKHCNDKKGCNIFPLIVHTHISHPILPFYTLTEHKLLITFYSTCSALSSLRALKTETSFSKAYHELHFVSCNNRTAELKFLLWVNPLQPFVSVPSGEQEQENSW